jgi:hypothetical protein
MCASPSMKLDTADREESLRLPDILAKPTRARESAERQLNAPTASSGQDRWSA